MAGHGGGAWKVAYADFVTAMMAFFLVMWITAQNNAVKQAIAQYFQDPSSNSKRSSGGPPLLPSNKAGQIPGPSIVPGTKPGNALGVDHLRSNQVFNPWHGREETKYVRPARRQPALHGHHDPASPRIRPNWTKRPNNG